MKQRGFTLIELLVVIGIIALLAAIIFPVFATARAKARQIVCVSNMRQIGVAIFAYIQDADELYPNAVDASDKYAVPAIWPVLLRPMVMTTPLLNPDPHVANEPGVLTSYIKNNDIWRCPSDTGYDLLDNAPGSEMHAYPTSYDKYGSSYLTRTELILQHKPYTSVSAYEGCKELGPAQVNVLMDAYGGWHGGLFEEQKRYNVLMADGHVVNQTRDQYYINWNHYSLNPPAGCLP